MSRNYYDRLVSGSRGRLAAMRLYADRWNADPDKIERGVRRIDWRAARRHGVGNIIPITARAGVEKFHGRDVWHADTDYLDRLRNVQPVDEVSGANINHAGWFCDAYQSETVRGYVAQLPGRNGAEQWLAFIVWSDADGITIIRDPAPDAVTAARWADDLAERVAKSECEQNERWHAARELSDECDTLRDTLQKQRQRFHQAATALRDQRKAGVVAASVCDILRERMETARDAFNDALADLAAKRAALAADYSDVDF